MNNSNALQNAATVTVAMDLVLATLKLMVGNQVDGSFLKNHERKIAITARSVLDKKGVLK